MNVADRVKDLNNNVITEYLRSMDYTVFFVGGAVRDILNGVDYNDIHDFDVIVEDIPAKDFARMFSEKFDVSAVVTLDEKNNIYRIVLADKINYIDVTNPINNSLEEDIKRRDLTINSIILNLNTGEILDLVGGMDDLKSKTIRAVSEENIVEDPLRILRIYRFASVLGYDISDKTLDITRKHKQLILKPAIERINCEIIKLFGGKYADKVLEMMDEDGLIDILFPIMIDVKKVPPNTHHHLDLFRHSLSTVKYIQQIYDNSNQEIKEHLDRKDFGGDTRLAHLKLAGFLHDIGKFSTWTIENDGRHRFIRHDEVGEQLSKGILKEHKFSKKQIDYISFIIRNHIYPSSVISAPEITDKIYMRFIRKAQENSIDLITIAKADRLSARGEAVSDEMVEKNISGLDRMQDFYLKIRPTLKPIPKLLSGFDVMKLRNIKPSRELGIIMDKLFEEQIEGRVITKEQAIDFVKNIEIV